MIEIDLKEYLSVLALEPAGTRVQIHDDKRVILIPPAPEPHAEKPLKQARRGRPLLYARPLTGAEIAKRYRAKKKTEAG